MPVSRPVLLALAAALLAVVAFYASSGAREPPEAAKGPAAPLPKRSSGPAKGAPAAPRGAAEGTRAPGGDSPGGPSVTKAKRPPAKAARTGMPAGVARALERRRTVVLFFFQRGSTDDRATARAVSSLRGRRGVAVFSAPISRLADYGDLVGGAGVTQAPAVVILGRDRAARLIEGFIDPETLAQRVADSR